MNDQLYIQAAMEDIRRVLAVPDRRISASVVQTKLPWLKTGRVVWARTADWKQALFWVVPERAPAHLNGPDGLAHLSEMIVGSTGPLPGGLPPLALAEVIRQMTHDPRGVVASRDYLQRIGPNAAQWLKDDSEADRRLFAEQFEDPLLEARAGGQWSLEFNCFNVDGGVERWRAVGDEGRISRASWVQAVPNRTFRWPMA